MTAMRSARRFVTALSVAVSTVLTACGGSEGGPVSPVVVTSPAPIPTLIEVEGIPELIQGTWFQFRAYCSYPNTSRKDCTYEVVWALSAPVATVLGGKVTAVSPGSAQLSASLDGKSGGITIIIKPDGTPWDSLPAVIPEQRAFLEVDLAMTNGRVNRWVDTLKIWVDKGFKAEDVTKTINFWRDSVPEIPPMVVVDSVTANVRGISDSSFTDPKHCGATGPTRVTYGVILEGEIRIATNRLGCAGIKPFAHGLGHVLGVLAHTNQALPDIMGGSVAAFRWSPVLLGAVRWRYLVPPNTKPI